MQKEQSRECAQCGTIETRIVSQKESAFLESEKYFLNWTSPCLSCGKTTFSNLGEGFLTETIEDMVLSDEIIDIWRKDDHKRFNPQDDHIALNNIATEKIIVWIDEKDTTLGKKYIIIESLIYRIDDLVDEKTKSEELTQLVLLLKERRELVKEAAYSIDSETKNSIFSILEIDKDM